MQSVGLKYNLIFQKHNKMREVLFMSHGRYGKGCGCPGGRSHELVEMFILVGLLALFLPGGFFFILLLILLLILLCACGVCC
jgi:hypothetical protein